MNDDVIPLDDLEMQIEMLYCDYGWDIPKIAALLKVTPAVVRVAITSKNLVQKETLAATTDTISLITRQQEATLGMANLKADEVTRQQQLAPMLAAIEITLLQRVMDAALSAKDPDTIATVVNSYKKLTQNAVINTVVADETKSGNAGPSVMVNVVNKFD